MKVVCLHTGTKYTPDYVDKLYCSLARNTTVPFDFEVIRETKYPGWWGKIEQFGPKERIVLLDIDIVITGNVDFLFEYEGPFCAWKDPWADGLNGSVHSIAPGYGAEMKQNFLMNAKKIMWMYKSDQEYLRDHTTPDYWPESLIQSYQAHDLRNGFGDARIAVFHGRPNPHEITDGWVKQCWK